MTHSIPCTIMRGGTSKGIYFLLDDLAADESSRNRQLLKLIGGDQRQVDGLGGGDMLNAKVAIISVSAEAGIDIDYRFVQVIPGAHAVDTSPTCGNILSGVGAFAIERGLVAAEDGETTVIVRDINTGAKIEQTIQTPNRRVNYTGDCAIAGAPGTAAPVQMFYLEFAGAKTGSLFPTGNRTDTIDGIEVTCIDAAMPMVIAAAADFGLTGSETTEQLKNNSTLFEQIETLRLQAAIKMTLGDARGKVIPKFTIAAAPKNSGNITARYFTPFTAHAAFAVSGGMALACAALLDNTVAARFINRPAADANGVFPVEIEHPSGSMQILTSFIDRDGSPYPHRAGVVRTTRLIMSGNAYLE